MKSINEQIYFNIKEYIEFNHFNSDKYVSKIKQIIFKNGVEIYYMLYHNSNNGFILSITTITELFNILITIKRNLHETHIN